MMPALFIGHGSPMNAIQNNPFTQSLTQLGKRFPLPKAILVISAHWMTQGTSVTKMEHPKTIHDFYGFPKALFDVQYPAPGSPEFASEAQSLITTTQVHGDLHDWGLDHGTWSVIRHMYPLANIPVFQLSLDMTQSHDYHFKLGEEITKLREKGVLIVGSGNIVHNLRTLKWGDDAKAYDWAIEFDEWIKKKIEQRDFKALRNDFLKTEAGKLSVPTMDHYYPLHYILGTVGKNEEIHFEYEEIQNSSISMRTFSVGGF